MFMNSGPSLEQLANDIFRYYLSLFEYSLVFPGEGSYHQPIMRSQKASSACLAGLDKVSTAVLTTLSVYRFGCEFGIILYGILQEFLTESDIRGM